MRSELTFICQGLNMLSSLKMWMISKISIKEKKPPITKQNVFSSPYYAHFWGVRAQALAAGGLQVQGTSSSRWLQWTWHTTGHGWAPRPGWWHLSKSAFEKGQKHCVAVQRESVDKKSVKSNPADTQVRAEGGRRRRRSGCRSRGCSAAHGRGHGRANIHTAALVGPCTAAGLWHPGESCGPWRGHAGAGFWQELWLMGRTCVGAVCEGLPCGRDSTFRQWTSVRKEWQRQRTPVPHSLGGRGVGNKAVKLSLGIRGTRRKSVLGFVFGCSRFLICNNQINFPQVRSVLPMTVMGKWLPRLYLNSGAFPFYFLRLSSWGGEVREWLGGVSGSHQSRTTTASFRFGFFLN